jgi:hypothetical protein
MEKPWKVVVAFVGVFIAGSIFGGLLALRLNKRDLLPRPSPVTVSQPAPQSTVPPAQSPAPALATPQTTPTPPTVTAVQPTPPTITARPNQAQPVAQIQLPTGMAVQAPHLMRRYVDKLDLTAEQKERIHPLIVRATNDLRRQQQTNLRETGIIIQHLQEDIAKELSPAQRGRIEEMAEKQRQIIEQREHQQQELLRQQQEKQLEKQRSQAGQKPPRDGAKPKLPSGKPADDGN